MSRHGLMKLIATFVAVSIMLSSIVSSAMAVGTGDWPPPISGTWYINQPTTVANETIQLDGDMIVNSTAIFRNVTIVFASAATNYKLDVTEYGSLVMNNCTIKSQNPSSPYYIRIYGELSLNYTNIKDAGYSYGSYGDRTGLWIYTNETVSIANSIFTGLYYGIFAFHSQNLALHNTSLSANNTGAMFQYSSATLDNITLSGQQGLRIQYCANIMITDVSSTATLNPMEVLKSTNVTAIGGSLSSETSYTYIFNSSLVTLNNLNITSQNSYGMYIKNSSSIDLLSPTVVAPLVGIYITGSSNVYLENGAVTSENSHAVQIVSGTDLVILRGTTLQSQLRSLSFEESSHLVILNSTLNSTTVGIGLVSSDTAFINSSTLLGNVPLYVDHSNMINVTYTAILSSDVAVQTNCSEQIELSYDSFEGERAGAFYNSQNIILKSSAFNVTTLGFLFSNSSQVTIETIAGFVPNGVAVSLKNSIKTTIDDIDVTTKDGVSVTNSTQITLQNSDLSANSTAVIVSNSTDIHIINNGLSCNGTGVVFDNTNSSFVVNNFITVDIGHGIRFSNSHDTVVFFNTIENARYQGILLAESTGNTVYYNFLRNNNNNGSQVYDNSTANSWDNGTIGNWYCNYNASDSDHDGIGDEPYVIEPSGTLDHYPIVIDADYDGINDYTEELYFGTNSRINDTDGDGIPDGTEIYLIGSDPLNNDTDDDGMPDGWEWQNQLGVTTPDNDTDPDRDNLTNLQEYQLGTDPHNNDTDSDGLPDGWEVENTLNPLANDSANDPDNDGLTNLQEYQLGTDPHNNDTDNDGMPDGWETTHNLNPLENDAAADPDNDGLSNLQEFNAGTLPENSDTDGDGMPDGWEVQYALDPLTDDGALDKDSDGLSNLEEYENGTNPTQADSDGDGITDGAEVSEYGTEPTNTDTDGDGLSDGDEITMGTNPLVQDTDGDGMNDATDPLPTVNNWIIAGLIVTAAVAAIVVFIYWRRRAS